MIDWRNLSVLIGPRWRNRDPYDRERLANAKQKQRGGHATGKNHSTGRRVAYLRIAKAEAIAKCTDKADAERHTYLQAVRDYWNGLRNHHP